MRLRAHFHLAIVATLAAGPAAAQFSQYTVPGSLALAPAPTREAVEQAMADAPWRVGAVRLAPWLALRDLTYVDNVYGVTTGTTSDVTATFAGGLHGYLPLGTRVFLGAYALPEYVWWRDLTARRAWNGRYGLGAFFYLSRLTLEARAGKAREQQVMSDELEQPVTLRHDDVQADAEFRLLERLGVFAEARQSTMRYDDRGIVLAGDRRLSDLDHDERVVGGGLRYRPRGDLTIGVGVDRVTTDFTGGAHDRSAEGTGPFVEVGLEGARWIARARVARVSLDPRGASDFPSNRDTTGNASLGLKLGRHTVQLYGGRSLAYALLVAQPYYVDERGGVSLAGSVGWRGTYRLFREEGRDSYVGADGGTAFHDSVAAWGVDFDVAFGSGSTLTLGTERTTYSSAVAGRDRTVNRIIAAVRFGQRLATWW